MHARLADVFRSLASLARVASRPPDDLEARRQLISQQVADVQGFVESSKFEPGAGAEDAAIVQQLTAGAQTVFVVLLAIARDATTAGGRPDAARAAMSRLDDGAATALEALADPAQRVGPAVTIDLDGSLAILARSITAPTDAIGQLETGAGVLGLYRELAAALARVASHDRGTLRAPVSALVAN
jgi:hypothetical protein